MKHFDVRIYGSVQGVFFRHSAREKAEELDIKGFVRNEPDGSLYLEVEGEEKTLEKFIDWCHGGPDLARVDKIDIKEGELKNFEKFEIITYLSNL